MQSRRPRKWAARRAAHLASVPREPNPSGHRIGDIVQNVRHLAADSAHRGDGGDGDQRGNQRILDGGGATIVLHQTAENGQHLYLQMKVVVGTNALVDPFRRVSGARWSGVTLLRLSVEL